MAKDAKKKPELIKIVASLSPFRKCVSVDAEGAGSITFDTSADQLAPLLVGFAKLKDQPLEITLRPLSEGSHGEKTEAGRKGKVPVHR